MKNKTQKKSQFPLNKNIKPKLNEKHKKRVSFCADEPVKEGKKAIHSTPFPRKREKSEEGFIKPHSLSFESDSDDNIYIKNEIRQPHKKAKIERKQKGSYSEELHGLETNGFDILMKYEQPKSKKESESRNEQTGVSDWFETSISSPISSPKSDVSFVTKNFDPERRLAKKILAKINGEEVNDTIYSDDEQICAEQIEILDEGMPELDLVDSDSESSEDDLFKVPLVVKNAKKFLNQCKIKVPDYQIKIGMKSVEPEHKKVRKVLEKRMKVKAKKDKIVTNEVRPETNVNDSINTDTPNEISDLESDDFLDDLEEPTDKEETKLLSSNLKDTVKVFMTNKLCIFVLKHPAKLYFCGKLYVTILSGEINVLGHIFKENKKEIEIYSPKGSNIYIETLANNVNTSLSEILTHHGISEAIDETFQNFIVLGLRNVENKLLNTFDNYIPQQIFPKIWRVNKQRYISIAEMRLQAVFQSEPSDGCIKIHPNWPNVISEIQNNSMVMVCGGKGVGKSTLLRYTVNELLNKMDRVVYIDLDPGQPEFTVAGCLSVTVIDKPLLGPNYTHLKRPERSYFIGEVNITHCISKYLETVKELISYCNDNIDKNIPWLVNYMGFTKTLGMELIISVIKTLNPTMMIQLQSDKRKLNFSHLLNKEFVMSYANENQLNLRYELKVLESQTVTVGRTEIEPKILRDMNILSYFSQVLVTGEEEISSIPPYSVNLSSIKLSYINGSSMDILRVINGNLVSLNSDNICLGFGIVRGIDTTNNQLYLITPEKPEVIRRVTELVMGVITLPSTVYTTGGKYDGLVPYVSSSGKEATTSIPKRSYRACQSLIKK